MTTESIMVCVYYGPTGERLIKRGIRLSQLLHCPLYVLRVDTVPDEELDMDEVRYLSVWQRLVKEAGGEFINIECKDRKIADTIIKVAEKKNITQLILGQSGQTLWQQMTKGSLVNHLLNRVGAIDIHIVAVKRSNDQLEETHELGVKSYLVRSGDTFQLSETPTGKDVREGVFFKDLHTEFDSGLFKLQVDGSYIYVKINMGKVTDPSAITGKVKK
ncbi:universal stress protein [Paenibacillus sp. 1P07SE]|uniref:universal stress protein n=1 Tax=Paenibacillus sp. 1P07SE TaxID=3132209 RepID=UPI0039A5D24A